MKTKLKIKGVEDKVAATGKKYTRFQTNIGWFSCFDGETIESLKKLVGADVLVETTEKTVGEGEKAKTFHNIVKHLSGDDVVDEEYDDMKEHVEVVKVGVVKADTQRLIVRQCVLKSVVELICAGKTNVMSIYKLAEEMETWVLR